MYELTIKKDEERAVTYDVCDKDQVNDIYCRGEVTFVPPDFFFEEGTKYKINVYRLVHSHVMNQDYVLLTFFAVSWRTMVSALEVSHLFTKSCPKNRRCEKIFPRTLAKGSQPGFLEVGQTQAPSR